MEQEGYIKFHCDWVKTGALPEENLKALIHWRDVLFNHGFIGAYPNGIGFGNISRRHRGDQFVISGSGTGIYEKILPEHFSVVTDFDIELNYLKCEGPVRASSESMTHGVIYREDAGVNGIIHIHHREFWEKLQGVVPATSKDAAYGTPEMAREIIRVFRETTLKNTKILVMEGHEEGILSFGGDLDEAAEVLFHFARKLEVI